MAQASGGTNKHIRHDLAWSQLRAGFSGLRPSVRPVIQALQLQASGGTTNPSGMARQEAGLDRALGLYTLCQAYQLTGAAVGGTKLQWDQNSHYTLGMASQEAGSRQDQQHEVLSQACPSAVAAARGIGLHGANYNIRHGLAWTGSKACSWARDLVPGLSIGRAGISGKQVHAWPVARRCHQPGPWHRLNNSSQYGRSWFL